MKFSSWTLLTFFFGATLLFSSCEKDDDDDDTTPQARVGNVTLTLDHIWGMNMAPFELNQELVHPKTGDTLTYTTFRYYISNIQLETADGIIWAEEESYHLIDLAEQASLSIQLADIPDNDYTTLHYTFGVDSARNVSGVQEGALDPANGMFWDWNSGYIMIKAEGNSPNAADGTFKLHLGGFSGTNNVVTERTHMLSTELDVEGNENNSTVHLMVNPARFWHTADGLATVSKMHMPNPVAAQMATDFATGINVGMVHN